MQFIDLKTQSERIKEPLFARFNRIMEHSSYIMGPDVHELEQALAKYVGVEHALGVASGTDALLIALMALDVGPGDEVITSAFSFFATVEVIVLLGATPIFVDIDPHTYNLDVHLLEAAITSKTKAIMPVSLYGQCADYQTINAIAAQHQIPVVEDGAQSFGATYFQQKSCGLTTIGCTSFFPSKPLGGYGDGGACFTNNSELAERMTQIRLHGQSQRYLHTRIGINGRLDTFQAAVLLEKLKIFDDEIQRRQEVALRYAQYLPKSLRKPIVLEHNQSVFAQYTIEIDHRDEVQQALQQKGIPTAVHYPVGLHQQPVIRSMFKNLPSLPVTERAARRVMSLPMHPYLCEADQKRVSSAVEEVLFSEEIL